MLTTAGVTSASGAFFVVTYDVSADIKGAGTNMRAIAANTPRKPDERIIISMPRLFILLGAGDPRVGPAEPILGSCQDAPV